MVSKELLSEVLSESVSNIDPNMPNEYSDDILYVADGHQTTLNIHELAHKCKEWALTKDYALSSRPQLNLNYQATTSNEVKQIIQSRGTGKKFGIYYECLVFDYRNVYYTNSEKSFKAKTEPEAIFKVCQWVLDNEVG